MAFTQGAEIARSVRRKRLRLRGGLSPFDPGSCAGTHLAALASGGLSNGFQIS
jgi:hypothetical protein